jgi:tetratricopeptide (TPR) repeat protein
VITAEGITMQSHLSRVCLAAVVCLAAPFAARAQTVSPADEAVELARQGKVDRGIELLRQHLQKNTKDADARVALGNLLMDDGQSDEAAKQWEECLSGGEADFRLLMAIGYVRWQQGQDGPYITRRRGMIGAAPNQDKNVETAFKRAHMALAAAAYEKARKLRPDDEEAAVGLASVYGLQEKHAAAAQVWKSLVDLQPKHPGYLYRYALATKDEGKPDAAAQLLQKAIALNPRLAAAHQALADYHKEHGHVAEAEQSKNRADFYGALPEFCTFEYSDENRTMIGKLNAAATVQKLVADPSDNATQFLAVLCWRHPHNELETTSFESLEARGPKTTPLLLELLKDARSTCTVRSSAHILARRKADGLLDHLLKILPDDVRSFGMDMDIAGSLDELGDPRAVEPLVQLVDPANAEPMGMGPTNDRGSARARAALALGAFNTPEARRALEQGTSNAELAPYCIAALYRISRDAKHLAALEKVVSERDFPTSRLGYYLNSKVGTPEAKQLAERWRQKREAENAAAKKTAAEKKAQQKPETD